MLFRYMMFYLVVFISTSINASILFFMFLTAYARTNLLYVYYRENAFDCKLLNCNRHCDFISFSWGEREGGCDVLTYKLSILSLMPKARESGTLHRYSLPKHALEMKYLLNCRPHKISLNSNSR